MPHDGVDPDFAFLDKKVEPCFRIHWLWICGSNEQASRAQVSDARDFIDPVTTPIDPHAFWRLHPRGMPPRVGRCLRRGLHNAPWALQCWRTNWRLQALWKTTPEICGKQGKIFPTSRQPVA